MTTEQAIAECEFWTTNVTETIAIGNTSNEEIGATFGGIRFMADKKTDSHGWSITVHRMISGSAVGAVENPLYIAIVAEIERRRSAK